MQHANGEFYCGSRDKERTTYAMCNSQSVSLSFRSNEPCYVYYGSIQCVNSAIRCTRNRLETNAHRTRCARNIESYNQYKDFSIISWLMHKSWPIFTNTSCNQFTRSPSKCCRAHHLTFRVIVLRHHSLMPCHALRSIRSHAHTERESCTRRNLHRTTSTLEHIHNGSCHTITHSVLHC